MKRSAGYGGSRRAGVLLIVRDTLIFLMLMLAAVLVFVYVPDLRHASSAGAAQSAAEATAVLSAQTQEPEEQQQAAVAENTPSPEPASTPTPTPTPVPQTANGDFSAVFPATDTGSGADWSYQDDNLKIAIQKVQSDEVTYFVADVWVKNISSFHTAFANGAYGRGHDMPLKVAKANGAIFAVSGDYYGARDNGVVFRNGELYRDIMSDDVCVLKKDGTMQTYQKNEVSALSMFDQTVWQAWAFGPALVKDGVAADTSKSKIKVRNPRCAIGYYEPGHYCFIVVDGRQDDYSVGMTLDELANTFVHLGCKTAYNLDGGATAMMVFQGEVISRPTNGGRASSDIIWF